jgi:hypothetical protein
MPNIPSPGEPMEGVMSPSSDHPMDGVVQPSVPPATVEMDTEPTVMSGGHNNKSGMLSSLGFGKKRSGGGWGLGKFVRHGEKAPVSTLPTVEENVPNPLSRKRSPSGSSGTHSFDGMRVDQPQQLPQDSKKVRKEAERMAREAEKQKRALSEKNARDASRAVLLKRKAINKSGVGQIDVDNHEWWKVQSYVDGPPPPSEAQSPAGPSTAHTETPQLAGDFTDFKGKQPASGVVRQSHHSGGHVDTFNAAGARFASPPLEDRPRGHDWRTDPRMYRVRHRELDEYSISSSDVHSVSHLSFATVDSDPGPARQHRRGLSAYSVPRMTSTSSLRTSFDTSASADFPQSVRSSNSFSLESQLVEGLARARLQAPQQQQLHPGALSPPPLSTLSLSPNQPAWQSPTDSVSPTSPPSARHVQPTYIALPPPRISSHHLHPRAASPYEHSVHLGPPSPGYAPKSAVNPIFQVVSNLFLLFF